jgi:hypothetical protein
VDPKGRASVPADALGAIAAGNKGYISHLNEQGFPFGYRNRTVYLGNEIVAALEPVHDKSKVTDERNLVHLVESNVTIDTTKLNRKLHARTMKIGDKTYLVGYTPFDWILYFNRETKGFNDEQKLEWAVRNNYSKIKIDASGRIQISRFVQQLGLDGYLGFVGHARELFMGIPQPGIVLKRNGLNGNKTETHSPEQLELPYPIGYNGGPIFMMENPNELRQHEIFYVEGIPPVIHQRGAGTHRRSSAVHPRGTRKHGSNLQAQLDLHSPDS